MITSLHHLHATTRPAAACSSRAPATAFPPAAGRAQIFRCDPCRFAVCRRSGEACNSAAACRPALPRPLSSIRCHPNVVTLVPDVVATAAVRLQQAAPCRRRRRRRRRPTAPPPFLSLPSQAMYPTINLGSETNFNPLHAPYPTPGSSAAAPPPPAAAQPARTNGPPGGPPPPAFPTLQVAIDPKFCLAPPVRCLCEQQPPRAPCGVPVWAVPAGVSVPLQCQEHQCNLCSLHQLPPLLPLHLQVKAPSQPPGEGGPAAGGAAPPPPPGQPAPGSSQPLDLELERKLVAELKAGGSSGSSGSGIADGGAGAAQVGSAGRCWGLPARAAHNPAHCLVDPSPAVHPAAHATPHADQVLYPSRRTPMKRWCGASLTWASHGMRWPWGWRLRAPMRQTMQTR